MGRRRGLCGCPDKTVLGGNSLSLPFHHLIFVFQDKRAVEGMEGWPHTPRGLTWFSAVVDLRVCSSYNQNCKVASLQKAISESLPIALFFHQPDLLPLLLFSSCSFPSSIHKTFIYFLNKNKPCKYILSTSEIRPSLCFYAHTCIHTLSFKVSH